MKSVNAANFSHLMTKEFLYSLPCSLKTERRKVWSISSVNYCMNDVSIHIREPEEGRGPRCKNEVKLECLSFKHSFEGPPSAYPGRNWHHSHEKMDQTFPIHFGILQEINLGKVLFRATLKVRLGSCFSTALKMDCTKINAHFKIFTACLREGLIHASASILC